MGAMSAQAAKVNVDRRFFITTPVWDASLKEDSLKTVCDKFI
jgi:hypothetical protein